MTRVGPPSGQRERARGDARRPPGHGLARWLLLRWSRDGAPLLGDLLEVYAGRCARSGRVVGTLWFWREVIVACGYARRDAWAEHGVSWRELLIVGLPLRTIRTLYRRPGYSLTVIVLTAVAAGSIGGLAGITHGMRGPSDPALDAVRVIVGTDSERGWGVAYLSPPELADLREGVDELDTVGVFQPDATLGLDVGADVQPVNVIFADAAYFAILHARVQLGRVFTDAEGRSEREAVVILSHALWRDAFASDPDIVGTSVRIAGRSFTVVGIMAEGFRDAGRRARTELWLPLGEVPAFYGAGALTTRPARWVLAVTRIGPAETAPAREAAARVAAELRRRYPDSHRGRGYAFHDLRSWWFGPVERPVRVMLAGGLWLLVLVLGNLAALIRMRRQEREGEMALRAALGAGRGSLLRVALGEATVLAVAAAALGAMVATAMLHVSGLRAVLGLPHFVSPHVDAVVLSGCATLILPLSLLFGSGGATARVGVRRRPARWLLAAEALFAAALLMVAGALVQDAREVARMPTGYEAAGLLTARLNLTLATTDAAVARGAVDERIAFAERFVSRAAGIPGVESAALVGPSVFGDAMAHLEFVPEGMDPRANGGKWLAQLIDITPGGLGTLGIAIRSGRALTRTDRDREAPVAVVDERIARKFWPDGDALGRRFCGDVRCRTPITVVGIAETAKNRGRERPDEGIVGDVYLPFAIAPSASGTIAVRADGTNPDVARDVRAVVAGLAPGAVVSDVRWMDDRLRADESVQRMTASLVAVYAALAALLALVGTYGLVAVQLGRSWRDTAIRMALGARWSSLAGGVVLEGVLPIAIGVALGAVVGWAVAPALTSQVSQVAGIGMWSWTDSAVVSTLLVGAAAGAATLPVLKLGVLRPMEVLRAE